jgi:hypothetical protein
MNDSASFRSTGIAAHVDGNGKPVASVRVENCRYLPHAFPTSDLEEFNDSLPANPELDEVTESAEGRGGSHIC